jgi:hypothetical protein
VFSLILAKFGQISLSRQSAENTSGRKKLLFPFSGRWINLPLFAASLHALKIGHTKHARRSPNHRIDPALPDH